MTGVWPSIETNGELEPAEGEWLHTNGAGAYSMSTVALMHTRRFHGLLVAALEPPLARYVILSHVETVAQVGKRHYQLSTHQFPDIAPTPGYRNLQTFAQDPLPRWVYRIGKNRLERRLCLVRGQNALVLSYTWFGKSALRLSLRPLLPMRAIHELRSEHGGLLQRVVMRRGEVAIQPVAGLPEVHFRHSQIFLGSPDWWRRFEYSEDQRRHVHYQEDLWTPGTFELTLQPEAPNYLVVAVGDVPQQEPAQLMLDAEEHLKSTDPGTKHSVAVRTLCVAADHYRATQCERPATIAGYPWLGAYSRDTLVSLPGLYLLHGRLEEAKRVLGTLLSHREDSLLLSAMDDGVVAEPSVDSSLWLFEATRQLLEHVSHQDEFVVGHLYPALVAIFRRVLRARDGIVWLSPDGLLVTSDPARPQTWMDSVASGAAVTLRQGSPIELQALWRRGCETLAKLARSLGDAELMDAATSTGRRTQDSFTRHFWCEEAGYPYDRLSVDVSEGDASIRPNAVLALDLDPSLFTRDQAERLVTRARRKLLTARGLRTLDPEHDAYVGYYEGSMDSRRAAYHQGVVWGYLLGAFARASLRLHPDDFELQMDLREVVHQAMANSPVLGHVAQVASGDAPHLPGGCPAQAWSVAELLRTLCVDLNL